MGVADDAKRAVEAFEKENPKLKGKARLTSGSRTWKEQLEIILDPKRKNNYQNIKKRFLEDPKWKDSLKGKLPQRLKDLTPDQLDWWEREIMKQAGKSPGFPHVGGKAQDVALNGFKLDDKKALEKKLQEQKVKILYEYVTNTASEYNVSISKANVFHVYK